MTDAKRPHHALTARHHILVVDTQYATVADATDDGVLIINFKEAMVDCKYIAGIKSIYNIRAYPAPAEQDRVVYFPVGAKAVKNA
jgi:hypothetical protein